MTLDAVAERDSVPLRDAESVHGYLRRICFKTGPPGRVGAELEWLVARAGEPQSLVPVDDLTGLLATAQPFPGASRVTTEPGGQVELSSPVAPDLVGCHAGLALDVDHLQRVLATRRLMLVPSAIDPHRPPVQQLHLPRYVAMAAYYDALPGRLGRVMMTSTAAVQVNLDAGSDRADVAARWELLHQVGPTLSASFANSQRHAGRLTGWKSSRQAVWLAMDPDRPYAPAAGDPAGAWTDYVLAAPVMMLRAVRGPWVAAPGFSFGEWVAGRLRDVPPPTQDDLDYHLTTLFPPVRPRGWFEVRYVDTQSPRWWPVPVAVLATLLAHPRAAAVAAEACEPVTHSWTAAARHGLDHPALARAARTVFETVVDLVEPELKDLVARFVERYVSRARCPADEAGPTAYQQETS